MSTVSAILCVLITGAVDMDIKTDSTPPETLPMLNMLQGLLHVFCGLYICLRSPKGDYLHCNADTVDSR